jgi:uncharacterized membrane protein
LLKNLQYKIPFQQSCFLWASSELKRYIPGNIWSFLGRAVVFSEKNVKKKDIAASIVVEAELLIIGMAVVSLLAFPFFTKYFINGFNFNETLIICLLIGLFILTYVYNRSIIHLFPKKVQSLAEYILPRYTPSEIFLLVCLSIMAAMFFGLGNLLCIAAIASLPIQQTFALTGFFAFAFLIGYLSLLTPAGFGVREGTVILGLSKFFSFSFAGFLSLFSRVILILAELIFVLGTYIEYKHRSKKIRSFENWLGSHKHEVLLFFLITAYVIYFTTISFLRYDNFYTGRFDLGNMAQTVWNTTRGRIFEFTNPNGTEQMSRLAQHADFILVLLAPFYLLWADPRNLLLIQTLVLSLGALFVYLIAKDVLKNKTFALVFAFAYLINPSVERTNLYDFHAVTLATTFLLGAYYFVRKKQYVWFSVFALLAALTKEEVWLVSALFGGFVAIFQKKRILGALIFLISAGMFYYLVWYAIPQNLGSQHFALSYYSDFGDKPGSVVKTILLSPQKTLRIMFEPDRRYFLTQIFQPLGYLSLLSPLFIIFAIPDLLVDLLSNNAQFHQIYYQYTAAISPFIFLGAIYGATNIKKFLPKLPMSIIMLYVFAFSLFTAYLYGPLPGAKEQNLDMITKPVKNRAFIDNYIAHIPKRFSVASSNNVGSHLSQRQRIYTLPLGYDKADIIVFLLNADSEASWSLGQEIQLVDKLKKNPKQYQLLIEKDQFIVFRRI